MVAATLDTKAVQAEEERAGRRRTRKRKRRNRKSKKRRKRKETTTAGQTMIVLLVRGTATGDKNRRRVGRGPGRRERLFLVLFVLSCFPVLVPTLCGRLALVLVLVPVALVPALAAAVVDIALLVPPFGLRFVCYRPWCCCCCCCSHPCPRPRPRLRPGKR